MNKEELIKSVAEKTGQTQKASKDVIDAFMDVTKEVVATGDKLQLIGFGTFQSAERAERKGRNPKTKEEILIPAKTVPVFKPGSEFKTTVDEKAQARRKKASKTKAKK